MTRRGKDWTKEELNLLEDSWGTIGIVALSKRIDRSINSVRLKAYRIGLGDSRNHYDGISLFKLSETIGVSYSNLRYWVIEYGFPVRIKKLAEEKKVKFVNIEEFWLWAESNKEMIDFNCMEENILGPEDEWVKDKRNADRMKRTFVERSHNDAWSSKEDKLLISMVNAFQFTYPEIAARLKRSQGAVKRRLFDLGVTARPIRLDNHVKYTESDIKVLLDMLSKGYSFEDIGNRLNKSALGIRGKLERMGYKFKNGVPYKGVHHAERKLL